MSEDVPIRITIAEKIIGLVLIIIGAIVISYSINPPAGDISHFSGVFVFIGSLLVIIGIFLIVIKGE